MKPEKSCGGVIFREYQGNIEYLVVQQAGGKHRAFSKGHVEEGESEEETALREIYEEVGLNVDIIEGFRDTISYMHHTKPVDKTVVFFLCKAITDDISLQDELLDAARLSYENALERLTYENARNVLNKAHDFLLSL